MGNIFRRPYTTEITYNASKKFKYFDSDGDAARYVYDYLFEDEHESARKSGLIHWIIRNSRTNDILLQGDDATLELIEYTGRYNQRATIRDTD